MPRPAPLEMLMMRPELCAVLHGDAASGGGGLVHETRDRRGVADVEDSGAAPLRTREAPRLAQFILEEIAGPDGGTALGEGDRDGAPESVCGAGDDHGAAGGSS